MADISTIGFAPHPRVDCDQHFKSSPPLQNTSFDENIEPLLRLQEHLDNNESAFEPADPVPMLATNGGELIYACQPGALNTDRPLENFSYDCLNSGLELLSPKFHTDPVLLSTTGVDLGTGVYSQSDYNAMQSCLGQSSFNGNVDEDAFAADMCSDPPCELAYDMSEIADLRRAAALLKASPGVFSDLGLSNDEPAPGSATDSVLSPEFPPYEYAKEATANSMDDFGIGAPQVLQTGFNFREYDEGRFPTFNGTNNSSNVQNEYDFSGTNLGPFGKTPELNTWQHAALSTAYADATKAAAIRALVEASYYPQTPDLYDALGRSLTGGGNLDYHPVYGVYRNIQQSNDSPSSLLNTPSLANLLNSPTFEAPTKGTNCGAGKGRANGLKKAAAPEFETKVLPRPSFASSSMSGGSFMMVNLRVKKGSQKKKGSSTGASKRATGAAKPKPLSDHADAWRFGNLDD